MAGETVPTVLNALKEKLEAMTDEDFQPDNIFPQIKAVQKKQASRAKPLHANSYRRLRRNARTRVAKHHLPARP